MRARIETVIACAWFVLACGQTSSDDAAAEDAGLDASAGNDGNAGLEGGAVDVGGASGAGGGASGAGGSNAGFGGVPGASGSGGTPPEASTGCGPSSCQTAPCQGKIYSCGDCTDNDGDGLIDAADPECLGPCQNNEAGYSLQIPDHNMMSCRDDCYFDQDDGSGNDGCVWSHECDPLEVPPDYFPEGLECAYEPDTSVPGTLASCAELMQTQSPECLQYCLPSVPNGCDCFGCCKVPQASTPIWLDTEDDTGNGVCDFTQLGNPARCKPCTIVPSCFNPCDECEICVGKPSLPATCAEQTCPNGAPRCGLPGQTCCLAGTYCISGCCRPSVP